MGPSTPDSYRPPRLPWAAKACKGRGWFCLLVSLWMGLAGLQTHAQPLKNVTLAWDWMYDVAGYKVYYGGASHQYTNCIPTGQSTAATISNLCAGVTYYFAVTDYDADGVESDYSGEMSYTIPFPVALSLSVQGGASLALGGTGQPGHVYEVLATRRFTAWQAIGTVTPAADGSIAWTVPINKNEPGRFFKLHDVTSIAPGSPPVLGMEVLPGQVLQLGITGQIGHAYDVEASTDGGPWERIGAVLLGAGGAGAFIVPIDSGCQVRLFRLRDTTYSSSNWPARLNLCLGTDHRPLLTGTGTVGGTYEVLASDNLSTWNTIGSLDVSESGGLQFSDPQPATNRNRFYRLRQVDP